MGVAPLQPGDVLADRYRVIRAIGHGGMGAVFEAEQLELGRRVAVKAVLEDDPESIARFEHEARAMARLANAHIAGVIDFVREPGKAPALVIELLEGTPLSTALRRSGRFPIDRAVRITTQMLEGLAAAHAVSVVHRDVKPSNVFLITDALGRETVKLLDFGIAKVIDASTHTMTTMGAVVGTPSYLAPEQIRGERVDPRTDIHAVGVCLFEMIAGRHPWRSEGAELIAEILRDRPLSFADVGIDVPAPLAEIVRRALESDREARFANASEMIAALASIDSRPAKQKPLVGARLAAFAVVALGLAAVGVAARSIFRAPAAPPDPASVVVSLPAPPPVSTPDPVEPPSPSVYSAQVPAPVSPPAKADTSPAGRALPEDPRYMLEADFEESTQIDAEWCTCYPREIVQDQTLAPLRCSKCASVAVVRGARACSGRDAQNHVRRGWWLCQIHHGLGPKLRGASTPASRSNKDPGAAF